MRIARRTTSVFVSSIELERERKEELVATLEAFVEARERPDVLPVDELEKRDESSNPSAGCCTSNAEEDRRRIKCRLRRGHEGALLSGVDFSTFSLRCAVEGCIVFESVASTERRALTAEQGSEGGMGDGVHASRFATRGAGLD